MFFSKIFAIAALALAPIVSAQTAPLTVTSLPSPFTIGQPGTIKWSGGTGDSVTIILRQGEDLSELSTISIIASNIKDNSYTWTPSSDLKPANDYALQLTQGLNGGGFSGFFTLQSAADGAATTLLAVAGSTTMTLITVTPNATTTMSSGNGTITMMMGTGTGTGTGAAMPRNTTMVSPTLSMSSSSAAAATTTATVASTTASHTGAAIAQVSAKAAFGLGAVAAVAMYLL